MKYSNIKFVVDQSAAHYEQTVAAGLMQVTIKNRQDKIVTLPDGRKVIEFINCSYLGLDLHPEVVNASKNIGSNWGVNFCCARSRFSIEPTQLLEERLSMLFRGRVITFPSVTTTHLSVLPLLASGILFDKQHPPKVKLIFDQYAHSSMHFLKPILTTTANIDTISHNDLRELRLKILDAQANNEVAVYIGDGIYSMGNVAPIKELLALSKEYHFYLYLDDAHGTSIFGEHGEGFVVSQLENDLPANLFVSFCLSKGFGCNGGGILLPSKAQESLIRTYGQIYAFSAALDFSTVGACHAAIDLHLNGIVKELQVTLRQHVMLFDQLMGTNNLLFSPIRMVFIGEEKRAIEIGKAILAEGFFVSVVFFPIVPRGKAQLRICIAANHTGQQIKDLVHTIKRIVGT